MPDAGSLPEIGKDSRLNPVPPKEKAGDLNRIDGPLSGDLVLAASVTASKEHTLAYSAGENGYIDGEALQRFKDGGQGSMVTAVPKAGYHFAGWSDGSKANPRSDVEVTADLTVTAVFAIKEYTISYIAVENGTIDGISQQTVEHGKNGHEVTAIPAKGYHFVRWSDGVTTASRSDTEIVSDSIISAVFAVNTYTVGGSVSGLAAGNEVILQNSGGDDLTVTADGDFTFSTALLDGKKFAATVLVQPTSPNQTCTIKHATGSIADANITDIAVNCVLNTYAIGGTVSHLPKGGQVVLRNNDGDDLTVTANGEFSFAKELDDGSPYQVTIHRERLQSNWYCTVENGAGMLAGNGVTNIDVTCFAEAKLQPAAGNSKIDLHWNGQDFNGATFNLCRAREDIAKGGFDNCSGLRGGILTARVGSPLTLTKLSNDTPYWLQLQVSHLDGRRSFSKIVTATPFGGLNDTGIDWCVDSEANGSAGGTRAEKVTICSNPSASHPGQDGHFGRDAEARARKMVKSGGGSAGFDFTKVCMSGDAAGVGSCPPNPSLGNNANNWACTRDNVTGLLWEVKTTEGLHSQSHTYSWFNDDGNKNGGYPGLQNGGNCAGSGCDTQKFVQAVNTRGLCGVSDWRLPTRKELLSIIDNSRFDPAIDTGYFPNSLSSYFWSSSPYVDQENSAWNIYFHYGEAYPNNKNQSCSVRLVRGRTATFGRDNP